MARNEVVLEMEIENVKYFSLNLEDVRKMLNSLLQDLRTGTSARHKKHEKQEKIREILLRNDGGSFATTL